MFNWANRSVLVTGATGFIGRHLIERLLKNGTTVTALVRPSSALPCQWHDRVGTIVLEEWTEAALAGALAGLSFDILFHLAAYGVRPYDRDINFMNFLNVDVPTYLVRLCEKRRAVMVLAGSCAEYAPAVPGRALHEMSPLETTKSYGASKAAGTRAASKLALGLGVQLRVLRLFNVYGPGEAAHRLLPSLVSKLPMGVRVSLTTGLQVRDFVYVDDAVDALLFAAGRPSVGATVNIWNVCSGEGHTVGEFAHRVAGLLRADPRFLGFGDQPLRPDEYAWLVGDKSQLDAAGWSPRYDLERGLSAAIERIVDAGIG